MCKAMLIIFSEFTGRYDCDLKCMNFKNNKGIDILGVKATFTVEWMPDFVDGLSTLF